MPQMADVAGAALRSSGAFASFQRAGYVPCAPSVRQQGLSCWQFFDDPRRLFRTVSFF